MFVRVCPYFPFSARVCLNQHHWIANRLQQQGIRFRQSTNAFTSCSDPERLAANRRFTDGQRSRPAADANGSLNLTPFFTERERKQAGVEHRLFFSQIEFCDNLIFSRRAAVDGLSQRLMDANRTIGQPNKLSVIFGHKISQISCRQTANRDRRSRSAQSGHPQSLQEWIHQAIRPRQEQPSHRTRHEQCHRLSALARPLRICRNCATKLSAHHRQISRRPAGHPGILRRPRPVAQTHPTDGSTQWQTDLQVSSSIIPDNWHSCRLWSAFPTLRLRTASPPPKSNVQQIIDEAHHMSNLPVHHAARRSGSIMVRSCES